MSPSPSNVLRRWRGSALWAALALALLGSAAPARATPPAPTLQHPSAGVILNNRGVPFSWSAVTDPGGQPVHYELAVERASAPGVLAAGRLAIDPVGAAADDGYATLVTGLEDAAEVAGLGGAVSAGVTFGAGRHGQGALVAGSDAVTFPASRFDPAGGTVELAVRLNRNAADIPGYDRFFTYYVDSSEQLSLLVAPDWDAVYGHVMHLGVQENSLATVPWLAGEWHHLAFTWGPGGQRLYLDGVLAAENPSTAAPPAGAPTIYFGNDAFGWGGIDAILDDVRLSAVARFSPDELRGTTSPSLTLETGQYRWRVRASAPGDPGPWSEWRTFEVDAEGPRRIELSYDLARVDLAGLGVEWDPMFFDVPNQLEGVDEADFQLVTDRIAALGLSTVRMFLRVGWWEPAEGTQDFEDPALESLYRQLAVAHDLGLEVILVVWRGASWLGSWTDRPGDLARTSADLLEELERRGLAPHFVTLVNEPNLELEAPFEGYLAIVAALHAELATRGLDVPLMGPDESGGDDWFARSVAEQGDVLAAFDSHSYHFDLASTPALEAFVADRRAQIDARPATAGRAFYLAEFGSSANIDAFRSADIDTFQRGIFSAEGALRALRAGASSVLHWCLHDVYYGPGMRMGYGLFRFKDEGWSPRPIYHAWSLLSRLILPGSDLLVLADPDPELVTVAFRRPDGAVALFAVNRGAAPQTLLVDARPLLPYGLIDGGVTWYRYQAGDPALADPEPLPPAGFLEGPVDALSQELPPQTLTAWILRPADWLGWDDAGVGSDGGTTPTDAGPDTAPTPGGCGCGTSGPHAGTANARGSFGASYPDRSSNWVCLLLVLGAVLFQLRRRCRRGPRSST